MGDELGVWVRVEVGTCDCFGGVNRASTDMDEVACEYVLNCGEVCVRLVREWIVRMRWRAWCYVQSLIVNCYDSTNE